jgi:hypothetical protein
MDVSLHYVSLTEADVSLMMLRTGTTLNRCLNSIRPFILPFQFTGGHW